MERPCLTRIPALSFAPRAALAGRDDSFKRMTEFDLIAKYFRPLAKHPGALALTDDAAVIDVPPGKQLVITKDAIAQGVHFIGDEDPALIARKLLRVNLSDLAAKGATPFGYLLMVALPHPGPLPKGEGEVDGFLTSFAHGLKEDQERYGLSLLGGDTIATQGPPAFSLTALGLVDKGKMLLRSGAKPGDRVFVSGTIGDGLLGLRVASEVTRHSSPATLHLLSRYQLPQPRLALGQKLAGIASACMDVSDGLAQDLGQLCAASGVGATIRVQQVPLSAAAREQVSGNPDLLAALLGGGDDYELLFTVPCDNIAVLMALGEAVTEIGEIAQGTGVSIVSADGKPMQLSRAGYSHFD